jgi:hypothetical protein
MSDPSLFLNGFLQDTVSTDVRVESGTGRNVTPVGVPPTVTTIIVTNITANSAISGGDVTNNGRLAVTSRGIVWSLSPSPTVDLPTKTIQAGGMGPYLSNLTGLLGGVTYYVRAYAVNAAGIGYGDQRTFQTTAAAPSVTTTAVTSITRTTATSGGNVTFNGGETVNTRGVCWSTSPNPTIALPTKTVDGSGDGVFTSSLTGLTEGTTYYVRAYATSVAGTGYGNEVTFQTVGFTVPTLTTTAATNITTSTATSGGTITDDGGRSVTARGICWNTSGSPTLSDSFTTDGSVSPFSSSLTGLSPGTTYYVRAYGTNSVGTGYGNQISFTTTAVEPTITTAAITNLMDTTATSGGNVTSNGGSPITDRGIYVNTAINPDPFNNVFSASIGPGATGTFTINITGLTGGVTYYVRAYTTNSIGISYGANVSFTTFRLPTVVTTSVTAITATTATSGGNVTADGGTSVTARGVCWSLSPSPTTADSKTTNGSGTGIFVSNITGLSASQTYYVRAYATNIVGTAYGSEISFPTWTTPTISTYSVSNIASSTITAGGFAIATGGPTLTSRGVVWGTAEDPVLGTPYFTVNGSGVGEFTSFVSSLSSLTGYYIRAYATNSVGTKYGSTIQFSTITVPSVSTYRLAFTTLSSVGAGGIVTYEGGGTVTRRGFVWNTGAAPTTFFSTQSGAGAGEFASSITGLTSSMGYFLRAFATNNAGTVFGSTVQFSTIVVPTVSSFNVSSIASSTITAGGFVTALGGAPVTSRGVVWSLTDAPTLGSPFFTVNGSGSGAYTSFVSSLSSLTGYFIRAYATNSAGTAYGSTIQFSTIALPIVSTYVATNIASSTIGAGGFVLADNGGSVTRRGFVWNTGAAPTTFFSTQSGTGVGEFTSTLRGLASSTGYFLRAFAVNNAGTAFGSSIQFSTITVPSVSSYVVTTAGISTLAAGGFVTSEGGGTVTRRGIVWNTGAAPTTFFSSQVGSGAGEFTSTISGLVSTTGYFVRAFATNNAGTVFGSTIPVSTIGVPTVSTLSMSTIYAQSVFGRGQIVATGGATTTRGLVWNTTLDPVLETGFSTIDGVGLGIYTDQVSTLTPLTNYYIRAYGTNTVGTVYGANVLFSTVAFTAPLVSTLYISSIGNNNATIGGVVLSEGGAPVTAYGVAWNLSTTTTFFSSVSGSGPGFFSTVITGLSSQSSYLVRTYATNTAGVSFGSTIRFSTINAFEPFNQLNTIGTYLRGFMSDFRNPSFYAYECDGDATYINDGGSDMYDRGNFTTPWLRSGTQYVNNSNTVTNYPFRVSYANTTRTLVDTDFYYVTLGYTQFNTSQSLTNLPLTVIGTRTSIGIPVGWQIGGNSGADGGGTLASGILYNGTLINGFTVHAFYRQTYAASDPSHCNVFILLGHPLWQSVFGTINSYAHPVDPDSCGGFFYTSGASVKNIVAIQTLLSKSGGAQVTAAECQTVITNFTVRIKQALGF